MYVLVLLCALVGVFVGVYIEMVIVCVNCSVCRYIVEKYLHLLRSGFLVIMEVDQSAYPNLNNLKLNYGDSESRVYWRSKQVVDFAYMFYVGKELSSYYLQLEDDVISSMNLFPKIAKGIKASMDSNLQWTTLEFSKLGFIAKLYKTSDLERLGKFLMMFYDEQPIDWLYVYFYKLLIQTKKILIKPALFQHFGINSSLPLKSPSAAKEETFADPDPLDLAEVILPATKKPKIEKRQKVKG